MPLPSNPVNNQIATLNGVVYRYSSTKDAWTRISAVYTVAGSPATSAGLNITSDTFVGNGVQTTFGLSVTPSDIDNTVVNLNGVVQIRGNAYSLSGNTITLPAAPALNDLLEVTITEILPGPTAIGSTGYTGSTGTIGYTGSAASGVIGYSGSVGGSAIENNFYVGGDTVVSGNIVPESNVTYSLGTTSNRFKDLYLSSNTLYLGSSTFSAENIFPFDLTIQPEVLSIQVQANIAGDDVSWQWTWLQSTLPYARATITNQIQPSVPLYVLGTYQVDNFAGYEIYGNMTQEHKGYFKWVDGAGLDNLVSWATNYTSANISHPSINSGNITHVQRYNFQIPSSITIPALTSPTVSYDVSVVGNAFVVGGGAGGGQNISIGPVYRGGTYTFNLDSSLANHPFYLTTDNGTNFVANAYVGEFTSGVTGSRNNGTVGKTTLVFQVPLNAPDSLFYQSATNSSMRGAITVKNLAVETNINGNYVIYFQHTHEGHKTPIELRPIPSLVNQMCVVYDATQGKFVPQDLATYVENTPSFKNKIREVAGTATLIAPNGVAVVPTVLIVEDASYLPLVDNKNGDIAFDAYYDTIYVWSDNAWRNTKPSVVNGYTGSAGSGYTGSAGSGYTGSAGTTGYTGSIGVGYTGSVGVGYVGSTGSSGYTGSQGTAGFVGSQGSLGYSGSVGYVGSAGVSATTTGNTAPVSPAVGDFWYYTTNDVLLRYTNVGTGSFWIDISGPMYNFGVSAADIVTINTLPAPSFISYLIVAGGAGGGGDDGGGGGAGGLLQANSVSISSGISYTITVGAGGSGGAGQGGAGSNSSIAGSGFTTITAIGGGGGGGGGLNGGNGGSGGGARYSVNPGSGTAGQGYSGGGSSYAQHGGGGGGAGGAGSDSPQYATGGDGGVGLASSITGTSTYYAGGGGGGNRYTGGNGGNGGGGHGGSPSSNSAYFSTAGGTNTGGGGGGGVGQAATDGGPKSGGSGVVILRYPDTYGSAVSTTGSPTYTVTGGYKIYKFTSSGTITF